MRLYRISLCIFCIDIHFLRIDTSNLFSSHKFYIILFQGLYMKNKDIFKTRIFFY